MCETCQPGNERWDVGPPVSPPLVLIPFLLFSSFTPLVPLACQLSTTCEFDFQELELLFYSLHSICIALELISLKVSRSSSRRFRPDPAESRLLLPRGLREDEVLLRVAPLQPSAGHVRASTRVSHVGELSDELCGII